MNAPIEAPLNWKRVRNRGSMESDSGNAIRTVEPMPTITRRELYDLVWATPMTKLAESFGLSDVGLAKICERHRVPTPPRGYWAKKEAGQRVKRAIFVRVNDPVLDRVDINASADRLPEPVRAVLEARREERKERIKEAPRAAAVVEPLVPVETPHPAITKLVSVLRKTKPDKHSDVVSIKAVGMPEFSASSSETERLILFFDRLVRECDRLDLHFEMNDKEFRVVKAPDALTFSIAEQMKRVPHVLTAAEIKAEEQRRARLARPSRKYNDWEVFDYYRPPPEFDRVPGGEFMLEIQGWSDGLRRTWRDSKTQRLENLAPSIAAGFEAHLVASRARREEQERREAERRELERRRELAKARRARETMRESLLRELSRNARKVKELRQWLEDAEAAGAEAASPDVVRMLDWVRAKLADLERSLTFGRLDEILRENELFPETDNLHDPLGDPPPRTGWW